MYGKLVLKPMLYKLSDLLDIHLKGDYDFLSWVFSFGFSYVWRGTSR